jgi:small-conductance mechanosensitive channel
MKKHFKILSRFVMLCVILFSAQHLAAQAIDSSAGNSDSTFADSAEVQKEVIEKVKPLTKPFTGETLSLSPTPKAQISATDQDSGQADAESKVKTVKKDTDQLVKAQPKEKKPLQDESIDKSELKKLLSWGKIVWAIIVLLIAHFVIKLIVMILERFAERSVKHRMTLKSIAPVFRIIAWVIVSFIVIQGIFKPSIETVFAVTASIGIAVGFAAQDILKNIFGGIMILFDRPFTVGDKIQVGEHYGEVKEIGLRSTRIVTKDDSLVSIPNAEVVNSAVSNSNDGEPNCQVVAEIYLPIDVDTNRARQLAIEAAQVSQYIYLNKPIAVIFINEVKERRSMIKMRLKAYVSDIRYEFAFQSDMTEIVLKEFIAAGLIHKKDID